MMQMLEDMGRGITEGMTQNDIAKTVDLFLQLADRARTRNRQTARFGSTMDGADCIAKEKHEIQ